MSTTLRPQVAKLTAEQAGAIRERCQEAIAARPVTSKGTPRKKLPPGDLPRIAAEFGVSEEAIMHVAKGRTWV